MAEPPRGSSWVWIKTSADPTLWGCRVPHLVLGKLGWMLRVPGTAPGGLGARIGWQSGSSANLGGVDKPKCGGKAVLRHPRGMEHGSPANDAPHAPPPPGERFAGAVLRGARNGSTGGASCPRDTPPGVTAPFAPPQQQGEKGRQHPARSGCLWVTVPLGGWGTKVFAKYCERPAKRKRYPTVYACSSPARRPSRRGGSVAAVGTPFGQDSGGCPGQDGALRRRLVSSVGAFQTPESICPSHVLALATTFGQRSLIFKSICLGQGQRRGLRWGPESSVSPPEPFCAAGIWVPTGGRGPGSRGCLSQRVQLSPRRLKLNICEKRDIPA